MENKSTGERFPLESAAVVGRAPTAGLRVIDTGVSREHASLLRREGAWWVQDLGSSNGTFVNAPVVVADKGVVDVAAYLEEL